jgi:hypothetical protein
MHCMEPRIKSDSDCFVKTLARVACSPQVSSLRR